MSEEFSQFDQDMTQRALDLAAIGIGQVSPSPLVGCVIVSESGEVVGEGTYIFDDVTHAEVIALQEAGNRTKNGTAYISLEPHAHHGRTPPCSDALVNAGIKRVVAPIEDPNPLVSGKGFEALRENGVEVVTGILKKAAERQNEKFIHFHETNRPFVHLKMATSLDGRIATRTGDSKWITGPESRKAVQELRYEYDAVLIGANTAAIDNPLLTDRSELPRNRKLFRIVLDDSLRLSPDSQIALTAKEFPTLVFTGSENIEKKDLLRRLGLDVVDVPDGARNLQGVLNELGTRQIQGVLVEGGAEVAGSFFDLQFINKISFFIAPIVIGGSEAPSAIHGQGVQQLESAMNLSDVSVVHHGRDIEITGYPTAL